MPALRDLAFGAVAGLCATMAMTAAMRRLYETLPPGERYPLPPREVTERALPGLSRRDGSVAALLAHFAYGALTGLIYACLPRPRPLGILYGPAVWAASYLGWIPAAGLLKPVHEHPGRRSGLMLLAHVVWGAALTVGLNELQRASESGFGRGPLIDTRSQEGEAGDVQRRAIPAEL